MSDPYGTMLDPEVVAGELSKLIREIDKKVVDRWNSTRGRIPLNLRYDLDDAKNKCLNTVAVAKANGDIKAAEEAEEGFYNTADSLLEQCGVPDPAETANSTDADVQQALVEHPVDHYDIRENPETRWEQCENGHTQNPEWAEQDCPKCIAEAWLNKELGELKDIHDKLAADPITGSLEVRTLNELRDAVIESHAYRRYSKKRLKKYREYIRKLDSNVAHRKWRRDQKEIGLWPERDGNRLWDDNELKDLAVPVDAIRATTQNKCVIPYQRVTLLYGTYGIGKSWIATDTILDAIETGGRVVYRLCDEGNATGIADLQDRLKTLKANPHSENIRVIADDMFDEDDLRNEIKLAIKWLLAADNPKHSIFVIDSLTFAGGAINDQNEFADWFKTEVQDLTLAGLTVLIIGHEGKNEPEKGPLGTTACPAKVHLVLRALCKPGQTPWTPDHPGELTITVIKDRVAATRIGRYKDCAIIRGSSRNDKLTLSWDPPGTRSERAMAEARKHEDDAEQIIINTILREGKDGRFTGKKKLREATGLGRARFDPAITNVEQWGAVEATTLKSNAIQYAVTDPVT